jgi:hypothetical protein
MSDNLYDLEDSDGVRIVLHKNYFKLKGKKATFYKQDINTCHGFQGATIKGEYIIDGFFNEFMADKNWLYTALTRATKVSNIICVYNANVHNDTEGEIIKSGFGMVRKTIIDNYMKQDAKRYYFKRSDKEDYIDEEEILEEDEPISKQKHRQEKELSALIETYNLPTFDSMKDEYIDDEFIKQSMKSRCYKCNNKKFYYSYDSNGKKTTNFTLDRISNIQPHLKKNCRPCCKSCNTQMGFEYGRCKK